MHTEAESDLGRVPAVAPAKPRGWSVTDVPAWICSLVLLALFLGAWEAFVRMMKVSPFILPPPSEIGAEWLRGLATASLWHHTWVTAVETLGGFLIALVVGVGLGAPLGRSPWLEKILNPFIVTTQVVPKVAVVPLFVLWFGFGLSSKVLVAAMLAFFPILTNTILGVKSVSRGHRDVMITLNATRWQTFRNVELPNAMPYIITGMEVGIVLAIIGAVVGEYLGGNQGLGALAVKDMNSYNTVKLFATIIHMSLLGFVFYAAIGACRRFATPWHESVQSKQV